MADAPTARHLADAAFDCYEFRTAPMARHITGFFGEDIRAALKEHRYARAASTATPVAPGPGARDRSSDEEGAGVVRPFALPEHQVFQLRPADGGPGDGPGHVDRGNPVRAIRSRKKQQPQGQPVT